MKVIHTIFNPYSRYQTITSMLTQVGVPSVTCCLNLLRGFKIYSEWVLMRK